MKRFVISYYEWYERTLSSKIISARDDFEAIKIFFDTLEDFEFLEKDKKLFDKLKSFLEIKEFIRFKFNDHIEIIEI